MTFIFSDAWTLTGQLTLVFVIASVIYLIADYRGWQAGRNDRG